MTRQDEARRARLAAALRDNLKRRKVQARAQAIPAQAIDQTATPDSGVQGADVAITDKLFADGPQSRPPLP